MCESGIEVNGVIVDPIDQAGELNPLELAELVALGLRARLPAIVGLADAGQFIILSGTTRQEGE